MNTTESSKRRTVKIEFTDDQADWMRKHYPTTYNQECCDYLGVSMRTMIRFARSLGLTKDPDFVKSISHEHCKLMQSLNRGEGNAGKVNLIKYGPRYQFRKGVTSVQRIGIEAWEAAKEKMRATRNELIRKERMRISWGLPQRTKMKLVGGDRNKIGTRYRLKVRGYIIPERGANEAYYTNETNRCQSLERTAVARGIRVYPAQCQ